MNPRIQELFIQKFGKRNFPKDNAEVLMSAEDLEKFAELIVKECARVASDRVMDVEGNDWGVRWAIKNHFGVEQ
jgi:hypothetical protein